MNEAQFLRQQLATEYRHLEAVLKACTDAIAAASNDEPLNDFLKTCGDYLAPCVKVFAARDRARLALHYARSAPSDQNGQSASATLEAAIASAHTLWSRWDPAAGDIKSLHRAVQALAQWLIKREAAKAVLDDRTYTVAQWRKVSWVDAKSILDERSRYARVEATLPLGVRGMERNGN